MKWYTVTLLAGSLAALVAGCASDNTDSGVAASSYAPWSAPSCTSNCLPTYTGPGQGVGTDQGTTGFAGATAYLDLVGANSYAQMQTLDGMFFNSQPQTAADLRLSINLASNSQSIIISYYNQNNQLVEAAFGITHPYTQGLISTDDRGWVNQNGTQIWKGFFQDVFGAIVLVVDRTSGAGDGEPGGLLGGSIWFQNFDRNPPNDPVQGSQALCWDISKGPYDCRSFLSGNQVVLSSSYYPTTYGTGNGVVQYQKLGDFDGIDPSASGLN